MEIADQMGDCREGMNECHRGYDEGRNVKDGMNECHEGMMGAERCKEGMNGGALPYMMGGMRGGMTDKKRFSKKEINEYYYIKQAPPRVLEAGLFMGISFNYAFTSRKGW